MKHSSFYFSIAYFLVDTVAITAALLLAYLFRGKGEGIYLWPFREYVIFILAFLPVWLMLLSSQGLYNPENPPKGWDAFTKVFLGTLSGWMAVLIVLYLWRSPQAQVFPRLIVAYGFLLSFFLILLGKVFINSVKLFLYRRSKGLINTLVIGNSNVNNFVNQIESDKKNGRKVVAVLSKPSIEELSEISNQHKLNELIVADPDIKEDEILNYIDWAETNAIRFTLVPSLFGVRSVNVETGVLGSQTVLYFKRTPLEGWGRVYKRILDIVFVVIFLTITIPIMLVAALLVKLSSRGPIIYKQKRIGQDGKSFYIHKFRSMYQNSDKIFKKDWSSDEGSDPRITPVGRFLRKTNIDELPQLFDVLTGTMSLVGPRPEQPKYVERFGRSVPNYLKRHYVKSGLTGWAQINGLRGDTSIAERIKYDLYYIENWSIWFDLRIIFSTILFILRGSKTIDNYENGSGS